nr:glycerophosphoryl diester phosphodiesterase membrane domain-containing protein [Lysinibacter cavernae]
MLVGIALAALPFILLAISASSGGSPSGGAIAASVLGGIALVLAFAIVAIWIGVKLSLVSVCIVFEDLGVRAAIARSWRLTSGYFWRTFGTVLLLNVIISVASNIILTPISFIFGIFMGMLSPNGDSGQFIGAMIAFYVITIALSLVISAITLVAQTACYALIYIDLRMRKEGLDVELMRFTETYPNPAPTDDLPNPYLPRFAPAPSAGGGYVMPPSPSPWAQ